MKNKQQLIRQRNGQSLGSPSLLGMILWVGSIFIAITSVFMAIIGVFQYISIARKKGEAAREDEERLKSE